MSGWARIATVATIIAFFVVIFLGLVLGHGLSRKPDAQRGEQCEKLATVTDPQAAVLEPQNTWSNFGYLVAGMLILYRSRNLLGAAVGLNLAFEFLFSSLYHSKLTESLQLIDVAWIYVLLLALIAYAIQSLLAPDWAATTGYWTFSAPVGIAALIVIVTVILGVIMGEHKDDIFESTKTTIALVAMLFVLLVIRLIVVGLRHAPAIFIVMPTVLIVATGIPTLFFKFSDGAGNHFLFFPNLCCKDAVLQAHAAWHILSAVLVLIAYDVFANFSKDGRVFALNTGVEPEG